MIDIHGHYSKKNGYNFMQKNDMESRFFDNPRGLEMVVESACSPKGNHLLWHICKVSLLTWIRMQEWCVTCPFVCPVCEHYDENDWHFLIHCNDDILAKQNSLNGECDKSTA
jgi:hypothetical protein